MVLVNPTVQAMMSGVAWFEFRGREVTAVYTDGTKEAAEVPEIFTKQMRDYHAYQNDNGPAADEPNAFALVSAIQSKRTK
jgi:hypothetical protein